MIGPLLGCPRGVGAFLLLGGLTALLVGSAGAAETRDEVEFLVPELHRGPFQLSEGPRPFTHRLSVSPGVGWVGDQQLFVFRVAYNPNSWLGYEASIGHNPGEGVEALFHMLSAVVRHPVPWRLQPYASGGFGLIIVFPGDAVQAESATELTFSLGAGLEFYLRDDLAIRGEIRGVTVLGDQEGRDGTVAYNYREATVGFSFYRTLGS